MVTREDWFTTERAVPRFSAVETILSDLQEGITSGAIEVASRLPSEISLARHYGVSRPVVREALRSAQALGLTRTRTGSGTYVIAETPQLPERFGSYSTRDLMESRPSIEPPAARLAAIRRSEEQADELLEICARMEEEPQPRAWVQLDSLFHASIAAASGNAVFMSVVSDIRDALSQQSEVINLVAGRRQPSDVEHREIAKAIKEKDPERAAAAMQAHLSLVEDVTRPLIHEEPGGS